MEPVPATGRSGPVPFHISDRPVYRSTGLDRQTGRLPVDRRPVGSFLLLFSYEIIQNFYSVSTKSRKEYIRSLWRKFATLIIIIKRYNLYQWKS
jgi:hypothetical protein